MIQKDVIERLISAGLSRAQAEVALLLADGAKMPDIKRTLGLRALQHARFLKAHIGPRSQIKALVDSCWQLMLLEKAEEKRKEEIYLGYNGKSNQRQIEKRYSG
jgi:hypothetical protein